MQFLNLEVVIAVLLFVGLAAFIVLVYASMRTLFGRAAHTIALHHWARFKHLPQLSLIALGYGPAAACRSKRKAKCTR